MISGRKDCLRALLWPLGSAAVFLLPALARADAASDAALELEIRYVDALSENGYVDFAPAVIEAAQKKWPAAKGVLEAATIRSELMSGKQDAVAKKIAARPDQNSLDTWILKTELAKSYFMYGKYAEAEALYKDFFKRFPKVPSEVRQSYVTAAYFFIDMLKKIGKQKETLPYYKLAMEQSPNELVMADLRAQYVQALLAQADQTAAGAERDGYVAEAEGLAKKMVWRQDTYFGDAINGLAHVKMLRGDVNGAQAMVKDYLSDLMNIHNQLKEQDPDGSKGILRVSPLPQCRYLIGAMLYKEAQAEAAKPKPDEERIKNLLLGERDPKTKKRNGQGAFNHLVNVYINYPESQSAMLAGGLVEEIKAMVLARYNASLTTGESADQRAKVLRQQYVEANVKFNAQQWDEAIAAYTRVISQNGMNDESLGGMKNMIEAFVRGGVKGGKLDDTAKLNAETVLRAMAEGFSGVRNANLRDRAGSTVGEVAAFFGEVGLKAMQEDANALFFRYYPSHPAATSLRLNTAKAKGEMVAGDDGVLRARDPEGAAQIYREIIEASAGDESQRQTRTAALNGLVALYMPKGALADPEKEVETAQAFVDHFKDVPRPGAIGAAAQFVLAEAYRHRADALRKAAKDGANDAAVRRDYAAARKIYKHLATELPKADTIYASTNKEKQDNVRTLENALYLQGLCLQNLPSLDNGGPKDKAIKAQAEAAYNDYLKQFPKGVNAPGALLQIGTLRVASGDVEGSRQMLDRLAKEFKDSPQAKNAIPMLANALFQMGMRSEATNTYKQMFAAGGTYTAEQYTAAANALLEANEAKLAVEACDCILRMKGIAGSRQSSAMLLRVKALLADKQVEAAYKQVTELLDKFGKTQVALEGNLALVEVAGEQVLREKTPEGRGELLRKTKKAADFIISRSSKDLEAEDEDVRKAAAARKVRLNLAVAEVAEKAYLASKETGGESTRALLGEANNAYRTASTSTEGFNPADPVFSANVQEAYMGQIRLTQALAEETADKAERAEILQDVVVLGEEYLKAFPEGEYRTDITNAVQMAKIEVGE